MLKFVKFHARCDFSTSKSPLRDFARHRLKLLTQDRLEDGVAVDECSAREQERTNLEELLGMTTKYRHGK